MANCTFFGHRTCPNSIETNLREVLIELITNQDVKMFCVGHQGQFDALVRRTLRSLKKEYTQINYAVVLAYMPNQKRECDDFSDTMLPEGIESVHPHYAISWRNRWMLQQSDYVVAYVTHDWGGAYQFSARASRLGKSVRYITTD